MYKAKAIIEKGTRYFYDENDFCYKEEPFLRAYKVKPGFPEGSSELQEAEKKLSENRGISK